MKQIVSNITMIALVFLVHTSVSISANAQSSATSNSDNTQSSTTTEIDNAQSSVITNSQIVWKGYKVTGSHQGSIGLKSGSLTFNENKLTGGEFELDMNSIVCTDLPEGMSGKLEGHLKSDDFFGVASHATSKLVIKEVERTGKNSFKILAALTIKGITKPIGFEASVYGKKATAVLKIDRTLYDIKYGSGSYFDGLQDKMIYDEFDLAIDLEF